MMIQQIVETIASVLTPRYDAASLGSFCKYMYVQYMYRQAKKWLMGVFKMSGKSIHCLKMTCLKWNSYMYKWAFPFHGQQYFEPSSLQMLSLYFRCLGAFHPIFVFVFRWLRKCACLFLRRETIVKKITQPKLPKTKNELANICNEPGISVNKR